MNFERALKVAGYSPRQLRMAQTGQIAWITQIAPARPREPQRVTKSSTDCAELQIGPDRPDSAKWPPDRSNLPHINSNSFR